MKETTITITIPDGYDDIDKEALAKGKISFIKAKLTPWRETERIISGFYVAENSDIRSLGCIPGKECNRNIFAEEKQAKAARAMAQLSQIIKNDERFGGPITTEEWENEEIQKYIINRLNNHINTGSYYDHYFFLAFHTEEQRNLFLQENEDLIKQYYMLD